MDDEDQFEAFNELVEEGNEGQCRAMWLAVILQAILDARGKYGNSVEQRRAQIWLEGRGGQQSDFAEVCDYAGIDFEKARKRCAMLAGNAADLVDFRAMKRDKDENRTIKNRRRYLKRSARNATLRAERQMALQGANDNFPQPTNDNLPQDPATNHLTPTHGDKK